VSQKNHTPAILIIGGSDSGGGAGIQADLRVSAAYGVAGTCALTGATAQNPRAVHALNLLSPARVLAQIDAVLADIHIRAIKIGMLGSLPIARAVAARIEALKVPVVLDPVLIATSGGELLSRAGLAFLRDRLLPTCAVLTPNLPEAEAILGRPLVSLDARIEACHALRALGARGVLLKGGHARGTTLTDLYVDAKGIVRLQAARRRIATHGTGCTFASAIACELALGSAPPLAVEGAHAYLQSALDRSLRLGTKGVHSPGVGIVPRRSPRGFDPTLHG
jgi:hydroxymethylpyrimidine/phosphomethylpyrimidine kinase